MNTKPKKISNYRRKWRNSKNQVCHCCGERSLFCWTCRSCGCKICQKCMEDIKWGVCGAITWICPDCGEMNGLGNQ